MNDDQIKELIGSCKAARRSKKPFHFFYCEKAADDEPLLRVGKRIPPADVKEIRRAAKTRKFAQGTVHSSGKGLVFQTDAAGKLQKHITSVFAKRVPPLKKAQVVGMDAEIPPPVFDAEELNEATTALSEAIQERDQEKEVESTIQEEVELAESAYQGKLEHLREARDGLKQAFKKANLSKAQYETAKDDLPNLVQELFNSSQRNDELRRNYEKALQQMNLSEEERQRRIEAFEQQEKSLPSSGEAILLSIRENVQRRAELAVAEKEVGVKKAAQRVAQQKVNQATVQANKALDALEDKIASIPELKKLSAAAEEEERRADEKTDRVFELQDEITQLQDRMRELSEKLKNSDDPDLTLVRELAAVEQSLRSKELVLDTAIQEAEELERSAKEKRKALKTRTGELAESTPELKQVLDQQREAKEALKKLVEAEAQADEALNTAEGGAEEAARRLRIQQLMRETQSLIDANRYFYEDLKKVNPRDPESVQQHRALLENGGTALFERTRELYTALVKEGATQEELEEVFSSVPSAWRPDALTEHMKWFKKLEEWEEAMQSSEKSAKLQEEIEKQLYGENVGLVDKAQETLEKVFESTESIRDLLSKVGKKSDEKGTPTVGSETSELLEEVNLFDKLKDGIDTLRSSEGVVAMSEIIGLINTGTELVGGVFDIRKAYKEKTNPKVDPRLEGLIQGDVSYDQADDPLLQRMRDEKLLAAVAKLGEKGFEVFAELAGELLPGLGLAVTGKDLIKSVVEAGNRIANAILTSELVDEAEDSGSTAIEALKQARAREVQLGVKASVDTAVKTLKTVGEIGKVVGLAAVGAGAAAGYAISMSASALKLANTAGNALVDFKIASDAQKYYKLAKAGDAEGARKLFEFSRKHAKGMLAWMAKEGDTIAMKYVSIQGVSDDELAKTCPAVLQRFLLRNASEEGEQQTFTEWLSEKVEKFEKVIKTIGTWVGVNVLTPAVNLIKNLFDSTMPEIPGLEAVPVDLIQKLSDTLNDFAKKRAFLERGGKKNRKIISDLDTKRNELDQRAMRERDRISQNLNTLSEHLSLVNEMLSTSQSPSGQPLESDFLDYLRDVLAYLKNSLKTNLTTMDMLADLA